ncbi:Hypothetical_protein [Hexamita inflata]|uniref:Hypothetical_protein n=1 Tax=Hexamita inflata TaxID=28002 RepID=A0AA86TP27_9EUKA|nr:Hypothetical protein HINF_LOCUS10920 [Hexamita inflata]
MQTIDFADIPNNSVVISTGCRLVNKITHFFLDLNNIHNPLRIDHCGFVVRSSARALLQNLLGFKNLSPRNYKTIRKAIHFTDDVIRPFLIESYVPRVRIVSLEMEMKRLKNLYFVRSPLAKINVDVAFAVGMPYEINYLEMIFSVFNLNKKEHLKFIFCSELIGLVLKRNGIVEGNVTNVLPETLCSTAGEKDVLRGLYGTEVMVRY